MHRWVRGLVGLGTWFLTTGPLSAVVLDPPREDANCVKPGIWVVSSGDWLASLEAPATTTTEAVAALFTFEDRERRRVGPVGPKREERFIRSARGRNEPGGVPPLASILGIDGKRLDRDRRADPIPEDVPVYVEDEMSLPLAPGEEVVVEIGLPVEAEPVSEPEEERVVVAHQEEVFVPEHEEDVLVAAREETGEFAVTTEPVFSEEEKATHGPRRRRSTEEEPAPGGTGSAKGLDGPASEEGAVGYTEGEFDAYLAGIEAAEQNPQAEESGSEGDIPEEELVEGEEGVEEEEIYKEEREFRMGPQAVIQRPDLSAVTSMTTGVRIKPSYHEPPPSAGYLIVPPSELRVAPPKFPADRTVGVPWPDGSRSVSTPAPPPPMEAPKPPPPRVNPGEQKTLPAVPREEARAGPQAITEEVLQFFEAVPIAEEAEDGDDFRVPHDDEPERLERRE